MQCAHFVKNQTMPKSIVVIIVEDDMPTTSEAVVIDVDDAFTPASEASGTENQAEIATVLTTQPKY